MAIITASDQISDHNLAGGTNLYSGTPGGTVPNECFLVAELGTDEKPLDGTGGTFTMEYSVGTHTHLTDSFEVPAAVTRFTYVTRRLPTLTSAPGESGAQAVAFRITSPNAADTDVTVRKTLLLDSNLPTQTPTPLPMVIAGETFVWYLPGESGGTTSAQALVFIGETVVSVTGEVIAIPPVFVAIKYEIPIPAETPPGTSIRIDVQNTDTIRGLQQYKYAGRVGGPVKLIELDKSYRHTQNAADDQGKSADVTVTEVPA